MSANVDSLLVQNSDLESTVVHALREQIRQLQRDMQQQTPLDSLQYKKVEPAIENEEKKTAIRDLERANQILAYTLRCLKAALSKASSNQNSFSVLQSKCQEVVEVLEDFVIRNKDLQKLAAIQNSGSYPTLRRVRQSVSLADSLNNLMMSEIAEGNAGGNYEEQIALLEEEAAALRLELEDCREDLKRDEDIFAEKVRDLKKCRKQLKEIEQENVDLRNRNDDLSKQLTKLTAQKYLKIGSREDIQKEGANGSFADMDLASDGENLDISLAVVANEPDISQLMEDLEVISKEKEELLADNLEASKTVLSQKVDFLESQRQLQEQLHHLEISIQMKEKVIHELQESKEQARVLALKYENRAGEQYQYFSDVY